MKDLTSYSVQVCPDCESKVVHVVPSDDPLNTQSPDAFCGMCRKSRIQSSSSYKSDGFLIADMPGESLSKAGGDIVDELVFRPSY